MKNINLKCGWNQPKKEEFRFSIMPIWIHKHSGRWHYHFLIEFAFWYIELQIGDDDPKEDCL